MTITLIEDEVREQLRAKAIDPGADPEAVRGVIADVVAATEVARARAGLPASSRSTSEAKAVFDAVFRLGRLQPLVDDDTVETLHERIKVQERELLVDVVQDLARHQ